MQPTTLARLQNAGNAVTEPADYGVDMFTEKGFALANRIAKAYASSDAVPAQFRLVNIKRQRRGDDYEDVAVPNDAAIANCLVAIEVARAVGMSITAVMQNADMIEGKLRWSGKFVIAAINASGRFSPLRFQTKNLGRIRATYREKGAWNKQNKKYDFVEKFIDVDNIECIAWALPRGYQEPRPSAADLHKYAGRLLDLYKAMGLPVVESAPVTMQMVVEEGWYSKPGSKWQTSMSSLMFMYRAGSFFGNIHAPDIVMGMGRTAEEERDIMTIDVSPTGEVLSVTPEQLRGEAAGAMPVAERVEPSHQTQGDPKPSAAGPAESAAASQQSGQQQASASTGTGAKVDNDTGEILQQGDLLGSGQFNVQAFSDRLSTAKTVDALDLLADELRQAPISDLDYQGLIQVYQACIERLQTAAEPSKAAQSQSVATGAPSTTTSTGPTRRKPASGGVNNAE